VLRWRTLNETRNAGFAVQHRAPGARAYTPVDFVASKAVGGTTTATTDYRATVNALSAGMHRFRLQQVDLDGRVGRTDSVRVQVDGPRGLQLAISGPNPVTEATAVTFSVPRSTAATVTLYDILGKRVRTLYRGTPKARMPRRLRLRTAGLPSGTYFLRLAADGRTQMQKLTVLR
jgi:hypothetical protein